MEGNIGILITNSRAKLGLTQDQFGRKYGVSGPAIFKFEKGYVKPSLDLWLRIAKDMDLSEQQAVLLWVRSKLPKKYQSFVNAEAPAAADKGSGAARKQKSAAARQIDPKEARKLILAESCAPKGLKMLLKDEKLLALYKPTGAEVQILRSVFGQLGDGTKSAYREALRLIREFSGEP